MSPGVTLVAGPPCAGKSTFVEAHRRTGETVLDYDEVYAEVSGASLHEHSPEWRPRVEVVFGQRLRAIRSGWVIRCAPRKQHRAILRRIHRARSVVLETPEEVCLSRLMASTRPAQVKLEQAEAIRRWWMEYERSAKDQVRGMGVRIAEGS